MDLPEFAYSYGRTLRNAGNAVAQPFVQAAKGVGMIGSSLVNAGRAYSAGVTGNPLPASDMAARTAATKTAQASGYGYNPTAPVSGDNVGDFTGVKLPTDASGALLPGGASEVAPGVYRSGNAYGDSAAALNQTQNQRVLPSVAGFLQHVRNLYAGGPSGTVQGAVPAPSLSERVASMYDQYNRLMARGDTQSLVLAAGLRKHLANLTSAAAGAEYGQGQLALGAGHLGVAQGQLGVQRGQLGLQQQGAYYQNTVHKAALNLLTGDKPDVEGARQLLAVSGGQNPNPQQIVPTLTGGAVHSYAEGPGSYVIDPRTGASRFVPSSEQYPSFPTR